jgi:Fe-S-cluster-containing dehydrogenase component
VVRVGPAGHFGTEALVRGAVRAVRARAEVQSSLLELPVTALRRILARADAESVFARAEAAARRQAFALLVAESPLGRALDEAGLAELVSALVEERHARGAQCFAAGEAAARALFVTSGLLELSGPAGTTFAARGDWVALDAALAGAHDENATARGDALLLALPAAVLRGLVVRHPEAFARQRESAGARRAKLLRVRAAANVTSARDAFSELERLESARSLLAIELDTCVRCGHCSVACADSHGTARFERRGEHAALLLTRRGATPAQRALLFPHACQHCRDPACLVECPTGAILRAPDGAVVIRDDACTGCGACAKACPWDALRMAPRADATRSLGALVATKCDLCHGAAGPECVSACPTGAIVRLEPARDVMEVRGALAPAGAALVAKTRGFSLARLLALVAAVPPLLVVLMRLGSLGERYRVATGVVAGCCCLLLLLHAALKRVRRLRNACARLGERVGQRGLSCFVAAHAVIGLGACVATVAHAGASLPRGAAGALAFVFWLLALSGAFGAAVYRVLPARLRRLESRSSLPEDRASERDELEQRLFAALSSQNEAMKALAREVFVPYASAPFGAFALLVSGRSLAGERAALAARVERLLRGKQSERLAGSGALVETSVALRALVARRWLERALALWLPLHGVLAAFFAVLLVVHVVGTLW